MYLEKIRLVNSGFRRACLQCCVLAKIILLVLMTPSFLHAHENAKDIVPIDHLIKTYYENHDIKFVLDPRVKAKINMVGIDLSQISQANLIDILLLHSFMAKTKEGVVYIFPQHLSEYMGEGFTPW
ncbi:MAG: hypothetical protein ACI9FR_002001 [Cryomorphaceae bacterium]|jgi:hypothetical protein